MPLMCAFQLRYLKRGVNETGRVANDVETEQIIFEDVPDGFPTQISSVVQNRGSIPLFWSQETSRLNLKPDIICRSLHLFSICFRGLYFYFHTTSYVFQCQRRTKIMKQRSCILKILKRDMEILLLF